MITKRDYLQERTLYISLLLLGRHQSRNGKNRSTTPDTRYLSYFLVMKWQTYAASRGTLLNFLHHQTNWLASHLNSVNSIYSTSCLMKIAIRHIHSISVHTSCVAGCSCTATHQSVMWCVSTLPLPPLSFPSVGDFLHFLEALLANSTEQMLSFPVETQLNNVVICAPVTQNATCFVIWYNKSDEDSEISDNLLSYDGFLLVWLLSVETQCWSLILRHWTH